MIPTEQASRGHLSRRGATSMRRGRRSTTTGEGSLRARDRCGQVRALGKVAAASLALLLLPTLADAQLVRGEVIDETRGTPISAVDVSILDEHGAVLRTTTTGTDGRFLIGAREAGAYRLRAERLGYETVTTAALEFRADSVVEVVVRMSTEAIALDPLEVVGRGESEINRATFEGLYQRRARAPSVGSTRIWVRSDPEMADGLTVREFVGRNVPTLSRRCVTVLVRGVTVNRYFRAHWVDTPVSELEGLEVYRRGVEAPPAIREVGAASVRCAAIVIWPRQWGDEPW